VLTSHIAPCNFLCSGCRRIHGESKHFSETTSIIRLNVAKGCKKQSPRTIKIYFLGDGIAACANSPLMATREIPICLIRRKKEQFRWGAAGDKRLRTDAAAVILKENKRRSTDVILFTKQPTWKNFGAAKIPLACEFWGKRRMRLLASKLWLRVLLYISIKGGEIAFLSLLGRLMLLVEGIRAVARGWEVANGICKFHLSSYSVEICCL
jgi:hypothetical protein